MLAAVVAVLVSVLGVAALVHASISRELRRQVDVTLQEQGDRLVAGPSMPPGRDPGARPPSADDDDSLFTDSYLQVLDADGTVQTWAGQADLPVTERAMAIAAGEEAASFEDVTAEGTTVRVYTVPTESGAFRFGRSLAEVERSLGRLTAAMVVIGATGVLVAAILGTLAAVTAIRPVHQLSESARAIKRTGDLSRRLPVRGRDEVASLARSFNDVLDDLETSQSLQRQLVADASHELRTPLTILRGELELALARPEDHDELLAALRSALDEAERLSRLSNDLLVLARNRAGAPPVGEATCDIDASVRRVAELVGGDGEPLVEITGTGGPVAGDPGRIEQVLLNLVTNARRYAHHRVRVVVATGDGAVRDAAAGDWVSVTVADDGPGFPPTMLPVTFERFVRPDAARSRADGGTGLGLAISAEAVRSLHGAIEAGNGGPLGGAYVTARFPMESARPEDRAPTRS